MKQIILLIIGFSLAHFGFSQCEPMTDFGDEPFGVAPDTVINFVGGELNTIYGQQIDVKIPESVQELGFDIMVDSATITGIVNLPPGLEIICNPTASSPCTYLGGTIGCGVIQGIPTQGGTYELTVNILFYTQFFGALPFEFEGYSIEIEGTVGIADSEKGGLNILPARPNPANIKSEIRTESDEQGEASLSVYDMVGKEVSTTRVFITPGINSIKYDTSSLPEGVYIYRIDAFGQSATSRLVVGPLNRAVDFLFYPCIYEI